MFLIAKKEREEGCAYKFIRELSTLLTGNLNRGQSTRIVVLGLTITSARQFVELNSRYSNERVLARLAPLPYRRSFALSISILRAFIAESSQPSLPTPGGYSSENRGRYRK